MRRLTWALGYEVAEEDIRELQENIETAIQRVAVQLNLTGIFEDKTLPQNQRELAVIPKVTPTSLTEVDILAGDGRDRLGQRIYVPATSEIDISQDDSGNPINPPTTANYYRWIALFVEYDILNGDQRTDDEGTTYYRVQDDHWKVHILQSNSIDGTGEDINDWLTNGTRPVKPTPSGQNWLHVADIILYSTTTEIVYDSDPAISNIHYDRKESISFGDASSFNYDNSLNYFDPAIATITMQQALDNAGLRINQNETDISNLMNLYNEKYSLNTGNVKLFYDKANNRLYSSKLETQQIQSINQIYLGSGRVAYVIDSVRNDLTHDIIVRIYDQVNDYYSEEKIIASGQYDTKPKIVNNGTTELFVVYLGKTEIDGTPILNLKRVAITLANLTETSSENVIGTITNVLDIATGATLEDEDSIFDFDHDTTNNKIGFIYRDISNVARYNTVDLGTNSIGSPITGFGSAVQVSLKFSVVDTLFGFVVFSATNSQQIGVINNTPAIAAQRTETPGHTLTKITNMIYANETTHKHFAVSYLGSDALAHILQFKPTVTGGSDFNNVTFNLSSTIVDINSMIFNSVINNQVVIAKAASTDNWQYQETVWGSGASGTNDVIDNTDEEEIFSNGVLHVDGDGYYWNIGINENESIPFSQKEMTFFRIIDQASSSASESVLQQGSGGIFGLLLKQNPNVGYRCKLVDFDGQYITINNQEVIYVASIADSDFTSATQTYAIAKFGVGVLKTDTDTYRQFASTDKIKRPIIIWRYDEVHADNITLGLHSKTITRNAIWTEKGFISENEIKASQINGTSKETWGTFDALDGSKLEAGPNENRSIYDFLLSILEGESTELVDGYGTEVEKNLYSSNVASNIAVQNVDPVADGYLDLDAGTSFSWKVGDRIYLTSDPSKSTFIKETPAGLKAGDETDFIYVYDSGFLAEADGNSVTIDRKLEEFKVHINNSYQGYIKFTNASGAYDAVFEDEDGNDIESTVLATPPTFINGFDRGASIIDSDRYGADISNLIMALPANHGYRSIIVKYAQQTLSNPTFYAPNLIIDSQAPIGITWSRKVTGSNDGINRIAIIPDMNNDAHTIQLNSWVDIVAIELYRYPMPVNQRFNDFEGGNSIGLTQAQYEQITSYTGVNNADTQHKHTLTRKGDQSTVANEADLFSRLLEIETGLKLMDGIGVRWNRNYNSGTTNQDDLLTISAVTKFDILTITRNSAFPYTQITFQAAANTSSTNDEANMEGCLVVLSNGNDKFYNVVDSFGAVSGTGPYTWTVNLKNAIHDDVAIDTSWDIEIFLNARSSSFDSGNHIQAALEFFRLDGLQIAANTKLAVFNPGKDIQSHLVIWSQETGSLSVCAIPSIGITYGEEEYTAQNLILPMHFSKPYTSYDENAYHGRQDLEINYAGGIRYEQLFFLPSHEYKVRPEHIVLASRLGRNCVIKGIGKLSGLPTFAEGKNSTWNLGAYDHCYAKEDNIVSRFKLDTPILIEEDNALSGDGSGASGTTYDEYSIPDGCTGAKLDLVLNADVANGTFQLKDFLNVWLGNINTNQRQYGFPIFEPGAVGTGVNNYHIMENFYPRGTPTYPTKRDVITYRFAYSKTESNTYDLYVGLYVNEWYF